MKFTTITYQAVKNLGNYESERLEASADLEEGEDPKDAALLLRHWVNVILEAHPKLIDKPHSEESSGDIF